MGPVADVMSLSTLSTDTHTKDTPCLLHDGLLGLVSSKPTANEMSSSVPTANGILPN